MYIDVLHLIVQEGLQEGAYRKVILILHVQFHHRVQEWEHR